MRLAHNNPWGRSAAETISAEHKVNTFQTNSSPKQRAAQKYLSALKKGTLSYLYKAHATHPAATASAFADSITAARLCLAHSWARKPEFGYEGKKKHHGQIYVCNDCWQRLQFQHLQSAHCASGPAHSPHYGTGQDLDRRQPELVATRLCCHTRCQPPLPSLFHKAAVFLQKLLLSHLCP